MAVVEEAVHTCCGDVKDSFRPEHKPEPIAFSNGWVQKFKRQRALKKYIGHGESGSANMDLYRTQVGQIQMSLEGFDPDNIYNCDETGLFLKAVLNNSCYWPNSWQGDPLGLHCISVVVQFTAERFDSIHILSEYQKTRSLGLGVETKADQVIHLQEELRERYVGNEETIADQKSFSVLNYLSMINREGPLPGIVEVAHEIMGREQYKGTFQQLKENGFVDDDNSEDSDNDTWATTTNLTWIKKTQSQLLVTKRSR
ncbi:hypothetical protein BGZ54_002821 [Gamsiella multidivaricata]|nr:hypothetical protein BGZ54_002821 [Gamsiella multidivaricata]